MNIQKIVAALTDPSLLTEEELNEFIKLMGYFIKHGHIKIVEELISRKRTPVVNNQAILNAIENGHYEMATLLFTNGYRLKNLSNEQQDNFYEVVVNGLVKGNIKLVDLLSQFCSELFDIYKLVEILLLSFTHSSPYIPPKTRTLLLEYIFPKLSDVNKLKFINSTDFIGSKASDYIIKYGKRVAISDVQAAIDINSVDGLIYFLKYRSAYKNGYLTIGNETILILQLFAMKDRIVILGTNNNTTKKLLAVLTKELNINKQEFLALLDDYERLHRTYDDYDRLKHYVGIFDQPDKRSAAKGDEDDFTNDSNDKESRTRADQDDLVISQLQDYVDNHNIAGLKTFSPEKISHYILSRIKFSTETPTLDFAKALFDLFDKEYFQFLCYQNRLDIIKLLSKELIAKIALDRYSSGSNRPLGKGELIFIVDESLKKGHVELVSYLIELFPSQLSQTATVLATIKTEATYKSVDIAEACFMHIHDHAQYKFFHEDLGQNQLLLFKKVYAELLPIIRLACFYENIFKEPSVCAMAERLAFLFRNTENALDYLAKYQAVHPKAKQPIHDACIFTLPKNGVWNVALWSTMVTRLGSQATKFLPWAVVIENQFAINGKPLSQIYREIYAQEQQQHFDQLKKKYTEELDQIVSTQSNIEFFKQNNKEKLDNSVLKKMHTESARISTQKLRALVETSLQTKPRYQDATKAERTRMIDDLINYRDLAALSLDDLATVIAKHGYARSAEQPEFARRCLLSGISEKDFNRCLDMIDKLKKSDNIPNIEIDGTTIGYPKYYLRKLKPGELRGFILGDETNCCQSIGKEGEACAIHGMTSENSSFYVIFDKETGNVIGQTWVCISNSKKKRLIFDSIEYIARFGEKMVMAFFKAAAQKTFEYSFTTVVVGLAGNTPLGEDSERHYVAMPEQPIDYNGYRDSEHSQMVLATTEKLEDLTTFDFSKIPPHLAYKSLLTALRKNDIKLARLLLKGGVREPHLAQSSKEKFNCQCPLLLTCIELKNIELFKMLLHEFQVNPNVANLEDISPLLEAAAGGYTEICKLLCEHPDTIIVPETTRRYFFSAEEPTVLASNIAADLGYNELAAYLKEQEKAYLDRKAAEGHEPRTSGWQSFVKALHHSTDEDAKDAENPEDNIVPFNAYQNAIENDDENSDEDAIEAYVESFRM